MEDDIPDDCLESMESLVMKFGGKCRFAWEVAFQKVRRSRTRTRGGAGEVITKFDVHSETSVASLAPLYAQNLKGCIDEFSIHSLEDPETEEAIRFTFGHYNKLRMARLQQNRKGGVEDKNHGRWKLLRLGISDVNKLAWLSRILDFPSLGLFQGIRLSILPPAGIGRQQMHSETKPFDQTDSSSKLALLNDVCRALVSNSSIRDVEMKFGDFPGSKTSDILSSLIQTLASSTCTLRRFSIEHPEIIGRWADLATPLANVVVEDTGGSLPSENDAAPGQVRHFNFGFDCWYAEAGADHEICEFVQDIQVVLLFVSKCFPYGYHLADMVPDWRDLETYMRQLKEEEGEAEKRYGRPADQIQQDVTIVGMWLERNQVGRALMLPSVAPTVPMALWSLVFEKAANSGSTLFFGEEKGNRPPLDGIFYVIQGLVQGGGLVVGSTKIQRTTTETAATNFDGSAIVEKPTTKAVVFDVMTEPAAAAAADEMAGAKKRTRLEYSSI